MWGRIDGRTKLEIARETVAKVLGTVPADQEPGLLARGHRTKGDRRDIEPMAAPAKGAAGASGERVSTMRFLGKARWPTPFDGPPSVRRQRRHLAGPLPSVISSVWASDAWQRLDPRTA